MKVILFDDPSIRVNLLPFTFTRPVAAIRTGILTIAEKWEKRLKLKVSFSTQDYLQDKFPLVVDTDNLWINGAVCPTESLVKKIAGLKSGEGIFQQNKIIAIRTPEDEVPEVAGSMITLDEPLSIVDQVWKIFQYNGDQIREDFILLTQNRHTRVIADAHTITYAKENIFLEEGVHIRATILNAEKGPIYLGKNSIVQEGAIINGPFSLGEGSHVSMGAKMRGDVSVGPFSKVGGEISSTVIFGYSNKGHDGFLGSAVLGEWCNLGADTNNSNLKNNYGNVKVWNYATKDFADSKLMFCGLLMGDHSKSGINTMFNTGTVAGVGASIFGSGFPPSFIPSFSWGGADGFVTFRLDKALETAGRVMARRGLVLTDHDREILTKVFALEKKFRTWEK